MKTKMLLATVAVRAFMSDTCEVVSVNGGVRVNKADYDADQAEGGAKAYKLDSAAKQDKVEQPSGAGVETAVAPGVTVPPAPSAPDFTGGAPALDAAGQPINPAPAETVVASNGAVPPTIPSPGTYAVMKDGKKFFVVNADGSKVENNDKIDVKGYESDQVAWAAIVAATPH